MAKVLSQTSHINGVAASSLLSGLGLLPWQFLTVWGLVVAE